MAITSLDVKCPKCGTIAQLMMRDEQLLQFADAIRGRKQSQLMQRTPTEHKALPEAIPTYAEIKL
jgi:phage FluMu protein Com